MVDKVEIVVVVVAVRRRRRSSGGGGGSSIIVVVVVVAAVSVVPVALVVQVAVTVVQGCVSKERPHSMRSHLCTPFESPALPALPRGFSYNWDGLHMGSSLS